METTVASEPVQGEDLVPEFAEIIFESDEVELEWMAGGCSGCNGCAWATR